VKFKVKKGTTVLTHKAGESFNVQLFSPVPTEIDVTFSKADVWFIPGYVGDDESLAFVKEDGAIAWYEYMIGNFYGFRLPKNKKNVDFIIIPKAEVELLHSKDDVKSHISDSDKAIRSIRRQGGKHWMPGQGLT